MSDGEPIVSFEDVWFRYPHSSGWAIKGMDLHVKRGECVCIAGASGCGKSTLCMCMNGLIPHHVTGEMKGSVNICGLETKKSSIPGLSQKIGLVFQNPQSQSFSIIVMDEVAFGPENLCVPPTEILQRVWQALRDVGMSGKEWENVEQLSDGQKQRIAVASVLSMKPQVLVLDEPFTQLDQEGRVGLLQVLTKLKSQRITIIITEHNIPLVLDLADRLVLMEDGELIFDRQVKHLHSEDVEQIKRTGVRWHLKKGEVRKCKCPDGSRIIVENVSYTYPNGTRALKNVSLRVKKGEFVGLVGENGSGKSTLLKCIAGLLKLGKGGIIATGIKNPRPEDLFGRVGLILQNPDYQIFEEDVFSEVAFPLKKMGLKEDEIAERVKNALESVNMKGFELKNPLRLSVGQRHRVALASVLAMKPKVMLLDEPLHGLDYKNVEQILGFLRSEQEYHETTVVMSSHDREVLEVYADRIIEIRGGCIS